jgi:RHS repeat-associated protein
VGRKVNGTLQRKWLYEDQLEPVAELDGADSLLVRFVYGTRAHAPDYLVKGGATYRIVSDQLGSVRLVVNVSDGTIVQRMDYDGYGRVVLDTNPGFQPFGYAGGLWDAGTGLVRFGARDYMPAVGRWTTKDPAGFAGDDPNMYGYVRNVPTSFVDPTGLLTWDFHAGAHLWIPPTAAAGGVDLSASYTPDGRIAHTGVTGEAVIGSLYDAGVSAGFGGLYKGPCGGQDGTRVASSLNIGGGVFGKYGGVQVNFVNGHVDGVTAGYGVGLTSPVSYTVPLQAFMNGFAGR